MSGAKSKSGSISSEEIIEGKGLLFQPRLGLGSTENENIALRRNHRELEQLCRKQKMLGVEQEYVMKIIDLNSKFIQVNYRRLTKRVSRIKSHLTEAEIKKMENDARKREFANKYRKILRNQKVSQSDDENNDSENPEKNRKDLEDRADSQEKPLAKIEGEMFDTPVSDGSDSKTGQTSKNRSKTAQDLRTENGSQTQDKGNRPITCPTFGEGKDKNQKEDESFGEIIPSLEDLIDQLHNIKPQQFYENQRKLKLYDIQLLCEELETKKAVLFRHIEDIINWDKKKEEESEEEKRKREEEEASKKPLKRKTTFMRSVLRNFSMELMMKTMQYGWTDLGKCRYLRTRGNDDGGDTSGCNTLAQDSMKIKLPSSEPEDDAPTPPQIEPGFTADGKMIRTADLLGLNSD